MIIVHAYTVKMWILLKGNYWVTTIAECTANSYNFVNHTFTISSSNDMLISIFPSKMVYFCLKTPITHSICIRTDESWEEVSTSNWLSCFFPLVKGCNLTWAQYMPVLSSMVKPLSANIRSPGSRWFNKPQFSVKWKHSHPMPLKWKK